MLMGLSPLKSQFTNLCKSPVFKFAVLKYTITVYKLSSESQKYF